MQSPPSPRPISKLLPLLVMALPGIVFYILLIPQLVNIPIQDDYYAVLDFMNAYAKSHGIKGRLTVLATNQHGPYKLLFEHVLYITQYSVIGHINFIGLVAFGSLFITALVILLSRTALGGVPEDKRSWLLVVPIAFLMFQLQYAGAVDWAMTSLQHVPVIFFSILALWLTSRDTAPAFTGACVSTLLAIAASTNGFAVVPLIAILLIKQRRYRWIPALLLVVAIAGATYAWRYNPHQRIENHILLPERLRAEHHGVLVVVSYFFAFLGSPATNTHILAPAIVFGMGLTALFVVAAARRYDRVNPAVFYSIAFLLITAAGVALLRSKLGAYEALDSHYRIYSATLLTLSFIFVAQTVWTSGRPQETKIAILSFALIISVPFCLVSDRIGYRLLKTHRQEFTRGMLIWERPDLIPPDVPPVRDSVGEDRLTHVYDPFGGIVRESERLGVYTPPVLKPPPGSIPRSPDEPYREFR
jgi:hypothetical protein